MKLNLILLDLNILYMTPDINPQRTVVTVNPGENAPLAGLIIYPIALETVPVIIPATGPENIPASINGIAKELILVQKTLKSIIIYHF